MDKGAHFHRCDFQVHSPRDLNWHGPVPSTSAGRDEYSDRFVKACRRRGIDAVAITDHHDFAFFPFIKAAAARERDEDGKQLLESAQLVVFPGMELTLGIPCQAILILDANFPEEWLPQVSTALSLVPNPPSEAKHALIQRLENFKDFVALHNRLNELSFLRGRYIVLPNVNSGGAFTLQRQGFLAHYKSMPCLGGYLDHGIDTLDVGDRNILDGRVEAYGFKPLGIFPTSDNRHDDFSELGGNTAWVKWAEPTAEALRQACLARWTRIFHATPPLPSLVIESVHVSLSKFLGPVDLQLNPQFNCLIGGRGTGKSTILEYLRWGLCDQPPTYVDGDETPDFQSKRTALIANTLTPHKASVTIYFQANGVRHVVRRKAETNEVHLKVGDEEFTQVREQDIRDLLPLQAYSQKQLSAVGVRAEELFRFVQAPVTKRLAELRSLSSDRLDRVRSTYTSWTRKRKLEESIKRQQIELASLEKQAAATRGNLKGLGDAERKVLEDHDRLALEQATWAQWQRNLDRFMETVRRAKSDVQNLPARFRIDPTLPNNTALSAADSLLAELFGAARKSLEGAEKIFSEDSERWREFSEIRREWDAQMEAHNVQYQTVKSMATQNEAVLKQIGDFERRVGELRGTIADRLVTLEEEGNPEAGYRSAREDWLNTFRERGDLLEARCNELTDLSNGVIRATIRRAGDLTRVTERLVYLLDKTGIRARDQKIRDLCVKIASAPKTPEAWEAVLQEMELLAALDFEIDSAPGLPPTPMMAQAGFSSSDIEKVARRIHPEDWLELSLVELEDLPIFEYRLGQVDYIPFAEASAGQQATALLRVLLHQKGPPLLIDQPEEDLDNQVILQIAEEIWAAKSSRQIIFTSHNANIVVNGDADLVVVCDYRTTGDQSGGRIKGEGAIDVAEIRREITTIMEGGKDAFRMRQEKYGF